MKNYISASWAILLFFGLFLAGCENDRCIRTQEYIQYEPVYKLIDEMRKPVIWEAPRDLVAPGKLFYYKGYLMINELQEGIHVIDNRDPANPINTGFLNIPGSIDMAVNGDMLYVDNYLDLVGINISNPNQPVEVSRVEDVFQQFYAYDNQLGYLVEYAPTEVRHQISCDNPDFGRPWIFAVESWLANADLSTGGVLFSNNKSVNASFVGGGSMARFTVAHDHLYTIDGGHVKVFDVQQSTPVLKNKVYMQWGIETLFPMAGNLFVGSNNGLLIYDISNPTTPEFRSTFTHAQACDPVVVSGNTAYVTLRDGNECFGYVNQLDVIDVSNLWEPKLIRSYPMQHPHGLSVVEDALYLCEGQYGLKTFDVSNPKEIHEHLLGHISGFDAYDVIVLPPGDLVMVIGKDGLYQYDASNLKDLKRISVIEVKRT